VSHALRSLISAKMPGFRRMMVASLVFGVVAFSADMSTGQLQEIQTGQVFESPGFFDLPGSLAYDAIRDRLACADINRGIVFVFDLAERTFQAKGGERLLENPCGLAFDPEGALYVSQENSSFLMCYGYGAETPDSIALDSLTGTPGVKARRLYIDKQRNIYIADRDHKAVYIVDGGGKPGRKISEKLRRPDGMVVLASGEILVADKGVDPILEFSPNGDFIRLLSRPESPTVQVSFSASGLAVDQKGWIYTIDVTRAKIVWYDPTGVNKNEWSPSEFSFFPDDIAIDRYDNIYVSETSSGRIRVFRTVF